MIRIAVSIGAVGFHLNTENKGIYAPAGWYSMPIRGLAGADAGAPRWLDYWLGQMHKAAQFSADTSYANMRRRGRQWPRKSGKP